MKLRRKIFRYIKKKILPYPFYSYNPYVPFLYGKVKFQIFYIWHILFLFASGIRFFLYNKKITKNKYTNFFYKNGFIKKNFKNNEIINSLFQKLEDEHRNQNDRERIFCHLNNFQFANNIKKTDSQFFLYNIENDYLLGLANMIKEDKIFDNTIKYYLKSDYRIVNVRCWRYFSNIKNDLRDDVRAHFDGLPHKTLKIMIYKGRFTKEYPALDTLGTDNMKLKYSVKGINPMILLDTCHLIHRAKLPIRDRDTIEITIQPKLFDGKPLFGGFSAGYPINPFFKSTIK